MRAGIITFQQNAHVLPNHPFNVQSPKFRMYSFEKMRMSKPIRIVLLVNNNFKIRKECNTKREKNIACLILKKRVQNNRTCFECKVSVSLLMYGQNGYSIQKCQHSDQWQDVTNKTVVFFHSLWLFNKIVRDEAFCINDKMNNWSALQQSMHV